MENKNEEYTCKPDVLVAAGFTTIGGLLIYAVVIWLGVMIFY
jgi:hypothetical protein